MKKKAGQTQSLNITSEGLEAVGLGMKQGYSVATNTPTENFLESMKALLKEYKTK
mgnify:CR=1 FL=1